MRFFTSTSNILLPLVLSSAVLLTGCNGGSGDSQERQAVSVPADSTFLAMYAGKIDHNASRETSSVASERTPMAISYFEGTLTAVNSATNVSQDFDWPLVVNDDGMVASQKTVTIEPGTYDFSLVVTKGAQQYSAVLLQQEIDDAGEYRLGFDLAPLMGDTLVDFDNVKLLSRLSLQFPADELVEIDAPQIGLVLDGVETLYTLNKSTGISDIVLNFQEGTHSFDVNLYNGNKLIGRSKLGAQSVDLSQGDDLNIDIISLQADVTVNITGGEGPSFIFNIPQEVIDHIGDVNNLNLLARITDDAAMQEVQLPVQEADGAYFVEHAFEPLNSSEVSAYIEFLDISSGSAELMASCADTLIISTGNTMTCGIELTKDYVVGGNLLATLAINVLDENKVAQGGAEVFVGGKLIGITGENFGTPGFIKTHVKVGEHLAEARKLNQEGSKSATVSSLDIHNMDIILAGPSVDILGTGLSCKDIYDNGESQGDGLYRLTAASKELVSWCDMTNEGWTLVMRGYQGNQASEWEQVKRDELNIHAVKSPTMTETFKFSDYAINDLHGGSQKYRVIADVSGMVRYAGGLDYCHDSSTSCKDILQQPTAEEAYMGTYSDEALTLDYFQGTNGYPTVRGGISSDKTTGDSAGHWIYTYSAGHGWQMGPEFGVGDCVGNSGSATDCHFSVWVK